MQPSDPQTEPRHQVIRRRVGREGLILIEDWIGQIAIHGAGVGAPIAIDSAISSSVNASELSG